VNSDSFSSIDFIVKTAAAVMKLLRQRGLQETMIYFLLQLAYSFNIFSIGKTKLIDK
jgi:hypothetical protein